MESRNPTGYESTKLYQPLTLAAQRVATHVDMEANAGSVPMLFVVDNDESTGRQDVFYLWTGIEASEVPSNGALAEQVTIAMTSAATATSKAGEAAGSATAAANAQAITEAARDQVIGPLARKLDAFEVDTFADLQAFISNPETGRCVIFVLSDETYDNLPRLHAYTGTELVQFITYTE